MSFLIKLAGHERLFQNLPSGVLLMIKSQFKIFTTNFLQKKYLFFITMFPIVQVVWKKIKLFEYAFAKSLNSHFLKFFSTVLLSGKLFLSCWCFEPGKLGRFCPEAPPLLQLKTLLICLSLSLGHFVMR